MLMKSDNVAFKEDQKKQASPAALERLIHGDARGGTTA
jgi:hypothetical protein